MNLEDIELDLDGIESGKWITVSGDFSVLTRGMSSKAAVDFVRRKSKPGSGLQTADTLTLLCEILLLDWKGLEEHGQTLPFTSETARRVLGDDRYSRLLQLVSAAVTNDDLFLARNTEELVKN